MQSSLVALIVGCIGLVAATVHFKEEFNDASWDDRWIESEHKDKEFGKWKLTAGKFYGDAAINQGIQTSQDAKFYATSAKFDKFTNKDKPLVIQFSVKHEQNIDCGGGEQFYRNNFPKSGAINNGFRKSYPASFG